MPDVPLNTQHDPQRNTRPDPNYYYRHPGRHDRFDHTDRQSFRPERLDNGNYDEPNINPDPYVRRNAYQPFVNVGRRADRFDEPENRPRYDRYTPFNNPLAISPMTKWSIEFDGDKGISVEDFVYRVERLKQTSNLSWAHVCANFHVLLKGKANDWFWLVYIRRNSAQTDWPSLKSAILSYFRGSRTSTDIIRAMINRRQTSDEDFDTYCCAVLHMNNQLIPPLGEHELLEILRGNLKWQIAQLIYTAPVNSVEQLRNLCRRAERDLKKQELMALSRKPRFTKQVQEISADTYDEVADEYEDDFTIDEINTRRNTGRNAQRTKTDTSKWVCWNCDQIGHGFRDCRS